MRILMKKKIIVYQMSLYQMQYINIAIYAKKILIIIFGILIVKFIKTILPNIIINSMTLKMSLKELIFFGKIKKIMKLIKIKKIKMIQR